MRWFKNIFGEKKEVDIKSVLNQEVVESEPKSFGVKCLWTVVRSNSIKEVLEQFQIKSLNKSNWDEAFKGLNGNKLFIFGPINGWVVIKGLIKCHRMRIPE